MSTESPSKTAADAAFLAELTELGRRVRDALADARENRSDTERQWNEIVRTLRAQRGDSPGGPWKQNEASESWRSDAQIPFARMKLRAARAVGENVVLKADKIPIRARVPDSIRDGLQAMFEQQGDSGVSPLEGLPAGGSIEDIEAAARRDLQDLLSDTGAAREFLMLWTDAARLGESISHATEFKRESKRWSLDGGKVSELSEVRRLPGCERVDPWECFRDFEREQIEDGRYFFREQPADKADIGALVAGDVEGVKPEEVEAESADGEEAGPASEPVFSRAAVVRALSLHGKTAGADEATDTAADERESPGRRVPMKRLRTGRMVEGWINLPVKVIEDFKEHWARDVAVDVSRSREAAMVDHVSATINKGDARPFSCEPWDEADTRMVQVFMANGEIVGFNPDPGPITYHREVWEDHENGVDGFGVAEAAAPFQQIVTGQVRSFQDNSKLLSNFILAVQRTAMKTRVEDVFKEGGVIELDFDEDVRKCIQQLQFTDVTQSLLKGIDMFLHFGDLATQMPREFHGQQPEYQSTATEVSARLDQAGKYIVSVARRFDGHIAFVTGHYQGYLEQRYPVRFEGLGVRNVEEMVVRFQRVLGMFDRILASDTLSRWANFDWWLREISELQDLPHAEAWKAANVVAAEMQAERESEERQLVLAESRGRVARLEAEARRADADADVKAGKLSLDRAAAVREMQEN